MNSIERREAMADSDSLPQILSHACDVDMDEAREMQSRINSIQSFFSENGFSRGKPKKMAVLYVMMRYGHTSRTVEKWWGKTDNSYNSFSADLGQNYLEDIKQLINEEADYDKEEIWTPGDKVYQPSEDPLDEFFDIDDQGRNAKITSFGE